VRRLALVAAALVVPVLPALAAGPAEAADTVICVPVMVAGCTQPAADLQAAINAAGTNGVSYTIRLAANTYTGTFQIDGTNHPITLQGADQAGTILTAPANAASQIYLSVVGATVEDLTVQMAAANASNDTGLALSAGASADHVTVVGTGTINAKGLVSENSVANAASIQMPLMSGSDSLGVFATGGTTITDSTIAGVRGFDHGGTALPDILSRVTIHALDSGVSADSGTVDIDDSVVAMEPGAGAGLLAVNNNDLGIAPQTINANHVTILGSGALSKGAQSRAVAPGGKHTSTINLTNSIVRGPATSLVAQAGNDGAQAGPSTATVNVTYTDYETVSPSSDIDPITGAGGVVLGAGNVVGIDPIFVNPASNYHLTPGSPVTDKGNPAAAGPATDRDGGARVLDGDPVVGAVRDMGAYELPAIAHPTPTPTPPLTVKPDTTAPDTTITTKLAKQTSKQKVKLAFSSEAGATFQCQVDGKAWTACTSPLKLKVKVGKHVVLVRAVDAAGNVDATPAKVKFKRVPSQ
jgi:hypothetical protein